MERIILTTGGTGGHIFPALAVAEELRRRYPGIRTLFAGSQYGPEKNLAEKTGLEFVGLPVRGFLGRGVRALGAAAGMSRAVARAMGLVRRFRPQIVVGFGGYAAFAPVLAARLQGIPIAVHEQNAVAGVSNRLLGRLARRVFLSLPDTRGFASEKCVLTGNPIRRSVVEAGMRARPTGTRHLLVTGGSQGARALNDLIVEALPRLRSAGVEIRHQTGLRDEERVRAAYLNAGYDGSCVEPFITDMAAAYAWADLALCRSGATSVAELAAAGKPSVLVPFPHATHDHQTCNARVLTACGASLLLPEKGTTARKMTETLLGLFEEPERLRRMGEAARSRALPDAAARVVDQLASLCGESDG